MNNLIRKVILAGFLLFSISSHAITVDITLGELETGIQESLATGDKLSKLVSTEIMQALDDSGLHLEEGLLLYSLDIDETEIDGGCLAMSYWGDMNLKLTEDAKFSFLLEALNKPIQASVDVVANFDANGYLRVYLGTRVFGKCIRWGRNTSEFGLDSDLAMSVDFELNLNAEKVTQNGQDYIRTSPQVSLSGSFDKINANVNINVTRGLLSALPLAAILDKGLETASEYFINNSESYIDGKYQNVLASKQAEWQSEINSRLGITQQNEYKYYRIPNLNYDRVKKIATLVNREFNSTIPVAIDYIDMNKRDILYYMLVGDREGLKDILAESAACQAVTPLQADMTSPKVYAYENGSCRSIDVTRQQSGPFYANSNCTQSISFTPESFADFCRTVTAPEKDILGNPSKWSSGQGANWTVAPASRFDISVDSISNNTQPLMRRENYRTATVPPKYSFSGAEISINDRRNIFDLCVQVATSVGPVWVDIFNGIRHHISCHPRNQMIGKYNHADIGYGTNRIKFDGTHYYAEYDMPLMGSSLLMQVDMNSNEVYNRAIDVIETYGIPNGLVSKIDAVNCHLEMRVYKKNYNDTNLKPLLAIHGGSWKYRGFGFYGLESQISHFTDEGYVVFAPFYRLAGESEGNDACNKYAWDDIVSDVEAALSWVKSNGSSFGMNSNAKVNLLGQSAGGHLAGWLLTNRPNDIAKAIIMYAPTDVGDYIENYRNETGGSQQGADILEVFLGEDLNSIDIDSEVVRRNSFPEIIGNSPSTYPPVYLIHGGADDLVPATQSVRMCNAYAGSANYGPANLSNMQPGQALSFNCGNGGSKLEVIADSFHAMEVCIEGAACAAGSSQAESQVRDALIRSRNWLNQ